jgi:hypothetical protein
MDDPTLVWPGRFLSYERTRTLSEVGDLEPALRSL